MDGKTRVQKKQYMAGMIVRHEMEHQAPLKIVKMTIFYHIIVLNCCSSLFERSLQVMFTVGIDAFLFRKLLIGVVKSCLLLVCGL